MTRPELEARIIAERESGLTMSQIAEKITRLGHPCTKNVVTGVIHRRAPELTNAEIDRPLHDEMDRVLSLTMGKK